MRISVFFVLLALANAKVYQRCEWARVLNNHGMGRIRGTTLADCEWVCWSIRFLLLRPFTLMRTLHLKLTCCFILWFCPSSTYGQHLLQLSPVLFFLKNQRKTQNSHFRPLFLLLLFFCFDEMKIKSKVEPDNKYKFWKIQVNLDAKKYDCYYQ